MFKLQRKVILTQFLSHKTRKTCKIRKYWNNDYRNRTHCRKNDLISVSKQQTTLTTKTPSPLNNDTTFTSINMIKAQNEAAVEA